MAEQHFTCGNCVYYRDQQIMGVCRLWPEQFNKHITDWCGQHKLRQPTVVALPVVEMAEEKPTETTEKPKRKYTRREKA